MGVQFSSICGESESEVMNLSTAAAVQECHKALVEGPAAARIALAKHRATIPFELEQILETVSSYATNEVSFVVTPDTPLSLRLLQRMPM